MNDLFAKRLKYARQKRGISQRAAAAELNVSPALLSHYEKGVRECGLDFISRAADFYDVSADFLLGRTVEEKEGALPEETNGDHVLRSSISGALYSRLVRDSAELTIKVCEDMSPDMSAAAFEYLSSSIYLFWRTALWNRFDIPAATEDSEVSCATERIGQSALLKAVRTAKKFPCEKADIKSTYPDKSPSLLNLMSRVDKKAAK